MRTQVRLATAGDVPALLELCRELDETHRREHPELFPATVVRRPELLEQRLLDPRAGCFVAEVASNDGTSVGGFVRVLDVQTPDQGVLLPRRYGLVDELVVAPAFRRTGLARELLRSAETWALARGIAALEVVVWEFNQAAQDLYEKQGYAPFRRYYRKQLSVTRR
jgi:ribosomal protein S18 acetylase RimI-like enzyme